MIIHTKWISLTEFYSLYCFANLSTLVCISSFFWSLIYRQGFLITDGILNASVITSVNNLNHVDPVVTTIIIIYNISCWNGLSQVSRWRFPLAEIVDQFFTTLLRLWIIKINDLLAYYCIIFLYSNLPWGLGNGKSPSHCYIFLVKIWY